MTHTPQTQLEKFKVAARELATGNDEARLDERERKVVKYKLVEKPE